MKLLARRAEEGREARTNCQGCQEGCRENNENFGDLRLTAGQ